MELWFSRVQIKYANLYLILKRNSEKYLKMALVCPWIATVVDFKILSLISQLKLVGHEHFFNTMQMIASQCKCA